MTEQAPEPSRALTARGRWLFGGSLAVAGLLLVASLVVPEVVGWTSETTPRGWAWTEAVLVNLGAAIALIAPIEWFIARLRRDVEEVEARQEQRVEEAEARQEQRVEEVREQATAAIEALQETVDSLTKLDRMVDEGMDEATAADHELFRSLASEETTGSEAARALERAQSLGRTSSTYGLRVPVSDARELHLVFSPMFVVNNPRASYVRVTLQKADSLAAVLHLAWRRETTAEILVTIGKLVRDAGFDERPSATTILGGLSDALVFADVHPEARPLIQYFAPQWALTESAIVAPAKAYPISHKRLDRVAMDVQAKGKRWLDFDSYDAASLAADVYFPLTPEQEARRASSGSGPHGDG